MTKLCRKCKLIKSIELFSRSSSRPDGRYDWCKACEKEWRELNKETRKANRIKYYQLNKETIKAKTHARYEKNKVAQLAYGKAYRNSHPDLHIRLKYGLRQKEYNVLLAIQNNSCWLCERNFKDIKPYKKGKNICVDHDHITNKVRGLACGKCNWLIGLANDSPELLHKIAINLSKETPYSKLGDFSWEI